MSPSPSSLAAPMMVFVDCVHFWFSVYLIDNHIAVYANIKRTAPPLR